MDKTTSLDQRDQHVKSRLQPLSCSVIGSMGAAPREYIIIIQAEFVQKKVRNVRTSSRKSYRSSGLQDEMLCSLT